MLSSSLTPRRLEALATLRRLTEQAGAAVHYSLVGARLRVSAWTAYGFMRELEKMGLVVRQYAPSADEAGGRPRILFAPAAPAPRPVDSDRLREIYATFAAIPDEAAAARRYLGEAGADVAFHLGFWLGRLQAAGRGAAEAARTVLEGGAMPEVKIQTLSAIGLGSALARLGSPALARRLAAAAARLPLLLEDAARVSDQGLAALIDSARRLDPIPAMDSRRTLQ